MNEHWYRRLFEKMVGKKATPFYNTSFNNGEKSYDGNPIFSTLSNGRLIRIIQEEPESKQPYLRAWIDEATDEKLPELVVTLELSDATKPTLERLLDQWFLQKIDAEQMSNSLSELEVI